MLTKEKDIIILQNNQLLETKNVLTEDLYKNKSFFESEISNLKANIIYEKKVSLLIEKCS